MNIKNPTNAIIMQTSCGPREVLSSSDPATKADIDVINVQRAKSTLITLPNISSCEYFCIKMEIDTVSAESGRIVRNQHTSFCYKLHYFT
jgi:hypothetical protein